MYKGKKIALVQVTFNDDYKFDQWIIFSKDYCQSFDYHIIVDDCSSDEYYKKVCDKFHQAVVLSTNSNGGSTKAYNKGIKYALEKTDADYIFLLDNDIRISCDSVLLLIDFMIDNPSIGMSAPIMLEKDSDIVACYGANITKRLQMKLIDEKKNISDISNPMVICETVQGGVNLSTRKFYEVVGLQDENLYMYSDEVDMGIRAKKNGFLIASIKDSVCWHQHINPDGSELRKPFSSYLMARNKIYIAKKNKMRGTMLKVCIYYLKQTIKLLFLGIIKRNKKLLMMSSYTFHGILHGIKNDMRINKYCKM